MKILNGTAAVSVEVALVDEKSVTGKLGRQSVSRRRKLRKRKSEDLLGNRSLRLETESEQKTLFRNAAAIIMLIVAAAFNIF